MTTAHELTVQTGLRLDPTDWFRATWRDLDPLPRPIRTADTSPGDMRLWVLDHEPEAFVRAAMNSHNEMGADEFGRYMLPYLSRAERNHLRGIVAEKVAAVQYPIRIGDFTTPPPAPYILATYLGLYPPLQIVVDTWKDRMFGKNAYRLQSLKDSRPYDVIMGLDDPKAMVFHMRRLFLGLRAPDAIRAWLANTEYAALDIIQLGILAEKNIKQSQLMIQALGRAVSPIVAPFMLEIMLNSRGGAEARLWLDEHPHETIQGLIPWAEGRGKVADSARDFLRTFARGHAELLARYAEPKLLSKLLDKSVTTQVARFDAENTPDWLRDGTRKLLKLSSTDIEKAVQIDRLPPLVINERALNAEQIKAVLFALVLSDAKKPQTRDAAQSFASAIRTHAAPPVLDRFVWGLIESWLHAGTPPRERWLLRSLQVLGSDQVLAKFNPLIRAWAADKKTSLIRVGLDILSYVGSDAALLELFRLEQVFKSSKQRVLVRRQLEQTAAARGLSEDQLGDRIVPDCGLDANGDHVFDYGARQFRFALHSSDLKPMIRDEEGKLRPDLPKPTRTDDPEKAEQALAEWRLIKTQIRDSARVQAARLERHMLNEWRWSWPEFERFFLHHPLMRHFAGMFVWGCYNSGLGSTFRVTSDYTFTDQADRPIQPDKNLQIGIVHPIHLSETDRSAWGQLLSDYDIIPPFPQIGRELYVPTPDEIVANALTRFQNREAFILTLTEGFRKMGWKTDGLTSRWFMGANVTTRLLLNQFEGTVTLQGIQFYPGVVPDHWPTKQILLKFDAVPPLVMSEVIRALTIVFKA